jgi:hypothetical protein
MKLGFVGLGIGAFASPRSRGEVWHLRSIWIPRRSITGRLLFGIVWRRRYRNRWIYKKVEAIAQSS